MPWMKKKCSSGRAEGFAFNDNANTPNGGVSFVRNALTLKLKCEVLLSEKSLLIAQIKDLIFIGRCISAKIRSNRNINFYWPISKHELPTKERTDQFEIKINQRHFFQW